MAKPKACLSSKDLAGLNDLDRDEVIAVLDLADELKEKQANGVKHKTCKGKVLAMIFQKPSTRTRVSFETGIFQLGGQGLYLSSNDLQLGRGETIEDTARVLSRYVDGIMARVFDHSDITSLAKYATIPVINGLSDLLHPCQALADLQTIRERKGKLEGLKLAYLGDGNNVAHSLLFAGAITGMNVSVAHPPGYECDNEVLKQAGLRAKETGATLVTTNDPEEALQDADAVYTDVWASMGQEGEQEKRARVFKPFQLNMELFQKAKPDAIALHCLPAHRGEEITGEVMESQNSAIFDQAENRLHAQKAVMTLLMGKA